MVHVPSMVKHLLSCVRLQLESSRPLCLGCGASNFQNVIDLHQEASKPTLPTSSFAPSSFLQVNAGTQARLGFLSLLPSPIDSPFDSPFDLSPSFPRPGHHRLSAIMSASSRLACDSWLRPRSSLDRWTTLFLPRSGPTCLCTWQAHHTCRERAHCVFHRCYWAVVVSPPWGSGHPGS